MFSEDGQVLRCPSFRGKLVPAQRSALTGLRLHLYTITSLYYAWEYLGTVFQN